MKIKILRTESIYIQRKRFDFIKDQEISLNDEYANTVIVNGIGEKISENKREKSPVKENKAITEIAENKKEEIPHDEEKKENNIIKNLKKSKRFFKKNKKRGKK